MGAAVRQASRRASRPAAGSDDAAGDGLSEDGSEEDSVGAIAVGDLNLGEGVAGDGDGGGREIEARIAAAHVVGEQGRVGGKVEAVGAAVERGVEVAVDEQARGGGSLSDGGEDLGGESR